MKTRKYTSLSFEQWEFLHVNVHPLGLHVGLFTNVQENENERDNKEIKIRGDMVHVSMSILRILILELNLWSKLRY